MNVTYFSKLVQHMQTHPETYNQTYYHSANDHCATHCFAGWAQIMAGQCANSSTALRDAMEWLELTEIEADYLFNHERTLTDFNRVLEFVQNKTVNPTISPEAEPRRLNLTKIVYE